MFLSRSSSPKHSHETQSAPQAMAMAVPIDRGWTLVEIAHRQDTDSAPGITISSPTPASIPAPKSLPTPNTSPDLAHRDLPLPLPKPSSTHLQQGLPSPPPSPPLLSPLTTLQLRITQQRAYITLQAELAAALDSALEAKTALTIMEAENARLTTRLRFEEEAGDVLRRRLVDQGEPCGCHGGERSLGSTTRAKGGDTWMLEDENARLRSKLAQCREVIQGLASWGSALGDENGVLREQAGEVGAVWRPDVSDLLDLLED